MAGCACSHAFTAFELKSWPIFSERHWNASGKLHVPGRPSMHKNWLAGKALPKSESTWSRYWRCKRPCRDPEKICSAVESAGLSAGGSAVSLSKPLHSACPKNCSSEKQQIKNITKLFQFISNTLQDTSCSKFYTFAEPSKLASFFNSEFRSAAALLMFLQFNTRV